ncbi:MAG: N-acetylmuramoyl-L-alanine amidase [Faecousia sp.]
MENRRRPQKRNRMDTTQLLVLLIAVLAVVLVLALIVAVFLSVGRSQTDPTDGSTQGSDLGNTSVSTEGTQPSEIPSTGYIGLEFTDPEKTEFTTMDAAVTFIGTSDPDAELTVDGKAISRSADGSFAYTAELSIGANTFTFTHKDETVTYTVYRRYVVESYQPAGDQTYNCGATVYFEVSARTGSTVTATFNGQTITLQPAANQIGIDVSEGFTLYTGSCALPSLNTTDLSLGQITFTAACDGITETYTSGEITCLKSTQILASDPSVTPNSGSYMDVGSGYICQIINYSAETYNGFTVDDTSSPYFSYLPQGTVDYCSTEVVTFEDNQYIKLRSGLRVYVKKNNPPYQKTQVVDCYVGTLPDHNELSVVSWENTGRYTILTLDTLWKAPFYFDYLPQNYEASGEKFPVTTCTYTYIDITFCYATQFSGTVKIPADDPLFTSAEIIRQEYDTILRLHLKNPGSFHGWDAYYNEAGQLCFQFLNPAKVTVADNAYGVDLTGVRIMIDVGHGGIDGGASKYDASGILRKEADCNLLLANALKAELESIGATVILNRTDDSTVSVDERIQLMRHSNLDYLIAIHHNSSTDTGVNGFEVFYYSAHNKVLANLIYNATSASGAYQVSRAPSWHVYFMGRQSYCPSVLTENGYLSNSGDLAGALDPAVFQTKAQALAKGIADYFLAYNPQ